MTMITLVHAWGKIGLYKDGKRVQVGSPYFTVETVLEVLGIDHESKIADDEWFGKAVELPENLEDVEFAKKNRCLT